MNVTLVESLVQAILSLSPEERALFKEKLDHKTKWRETLQQIKVHKMAIFTRRGGRPIESSIDEIFQQMREERSEELMQASLPELEEK